jgi:hypothetical protein
MAASSGEHGLVPCLPPGPVPRCRPVRVIVDHVVDTATAVLDRRHRRLRRVGNVDEGPRHGRRRSPGTCACGTARTAPRPSQAMCPARRTRRSAARSPPFSRRPAPSANCADVHQPKCFWPQPERREQLGEADCLAAPARGADRLISSARSRPARRDGKRRDGLGFARSHQVVHDRSFSEFPKARCFELTASERRQPRVKKGRRRWGEPRPAAAQGWCSSPAPFGPISPAITPLRDSGWLIGHSE